jgi:hypothetical protein
VLIEYWLYRGQREDCARGVLSRELDIPAGTAPPDLTDWLDVALNVKGVEEWVLRMWRDLHWGIGGSVTGDLITPEGVMIRATTTLPPHFGKVVARYGLTPALAIAKLTEMYLTIDDNQFKRKIREVEEAMAERSMQTGAGSGMPRRGEAGRGKGSF